nr:MAG TPA: hypothetical protein [Caudoviricetes sp.]
MYFNCVCRQKENGFAFPGLQIKLRNVARFLILGRRKPFLYV